MDPEDHSKEDSVCCDCVGEEYLRKEIMRKGKHEKCAFCGKATQTYTLEQLTERIEDVLLNHFERTPTEPSDWQYHLLADRESTYNWYREGKTLAEILMDEFDIVKGAADHIAESLESKYYDMDAHAVGEETEFGSDVHYEAKGITDEYWSEVWSAFHQTLREETRFFSSKVVDILDSIFDGLDKSTTWGGKAVLTTIGPGKDIASLFRARVFQSRERLLEALCKADTMLGPPTSLHAMNGRMNARGISVFYGATGESVALAEVRPPVGSKVAVARFELIRPLQLLDLRALGDVREMASVFDPLYLKKMEKAMFLRSLGKRMTTPVMPDDELFDYLPTQAIADYLAAQTNVQYDGIIYPSIQVAGENKTNIVLFHKSARVEPVELPPGTDIEVRDWDDDLNESYQVIEWAPKRKKAASSVSENNKVIDKREPTLRIDLQSVYVHAVESVEYKTSPHVVHRYRFKKQAYKRKRTDLDF